MSEIKIHVFHTGEVCVAPELPFGGEHCNPVKITNADGQFVLLFSDGGYARKSWEQMITSEISSDKEKQKKSLAWIREQSLDENCVELLANHDPEIKTHLIEL